MIISEMQSKLATWSTENKERKFDRLLRLIADRDWLSEAARITLASSGAGTPGVDGVDRRMLEANLQHELATIREELLAGSYSPLPRRKDERPHAAYKARRRIFMGKGQERMDTASNVQPERFCEVVF